MGLLGERARSQLVIESTEQEDTSAKRALQRRQTELQLAREARKARNLLYANSWMGLTSDGKRTKYFKVMAWLKEQDELAQHRRANKGHSLLNAARPNPNYSSLGGAGHGPMADETATLGQPAPDFGSLDWLMPSEPPPSERPKRARPQSPTTIMFPTYEQLDECMCHVSKEGNDTTTNVSEHMLSFINQQLADEDPRLSELFDVSDPCGEEDGENKSGKNYIGPNTPKAVDAGVGGRVGGIKVVQVAQGLAVQRRHV